MAITSRREPFAWRTGVTLLVVAAAVLVPLWLALTLFQKMGRQIDDELNFQRDGVKVIPMQSHRSGPPHRSRHAKGAATPPPASLHAR